MVGIAAVLVGMTSGLFLGLTSGYLGVVPIEVVDR